MTIQLGKYGLWRGWPGLDAEIAVLTAAVLVVIASTVTGRNTGTRSRL